MEHLKACAEIATQRTINWQKFCMKDDCKCTMFLYPKSLALHSACKFGQFLLSLGIESMTLQLRELEQLSLPVAQTVKSHMVLIEFSLSLFV